MMVVTLTVSSTFETKEQKAYNILFRLNVKEDLKKKASWAVSLVGRINLLHMRLRKKRIEGQDYLTKKIELRGKLTLKMEEFKNARALLTDYEISPEELLR